MTIKEFTTEELRRLANSRHDYTDEVRAELALREHAAAEALFASNLQPSQACTCNDLVDAINDQIGRRGCDGCAAAMATEFGDHPDTAAARMRWALDAETRVNHALAGGGS